MTAPRENWEIPVPSPETSKFYIKKNTIFWLSAKPIWMTHLEFSTSFSSPLLGKISAVLVWLCVWELFLVDCESVCVPAPPISVSMELLSYDGRLHHPVDEEKKRERRKGHTLLCVGCAAYVTSPLEMKAGWILSQRHLGGGSAIPSMDSLRLFVLIFFAVFFSFFNFVKTINWE